MDQHYQGAPGPDPMLGQTIGNYRVSQKLGEGGMGSVYLAEHPHIGKKVALKILHAEFASNPTSSPGSSTKPRPSTTSATRTSSTSSTTAC